MSKHIDPLLIDLPMPLVTPRLSIRPVMPGDGAATAEAVLETWSMLNRWMPWAENKNDNTAAKQEVRVQQVYAKFILRDDLGMIGLERESGRPVIWTGLHRLDWKTRRFEIGYWVRQSAQGNGYATEATNALTRYAFEALNANRVEIGHAAGNEASRRVIEKLEFEHEALRRKYLPLPNGDIADEHHYVRLSPDGLPPLAVTWGS